MLRIDALSELVPDAIKLTQLYIAEQAQQPPLPQQQQRPQQPQPPPQQPQADMQQPQGPPGQGPSDQSQQQMPTDPAELAGILLAKMVPVDEDLDDPQPYMDHFKTWLKGDEGKDADPVLRAAVRAQWKQYNQMQQVAQQAVQQQQMQMQAQMIAMQEQAKLPLEQSRQQGKLADTSLKGQIEMAKLQAAPAPPGPTIQPTPPDNTVRDKIVESALTAAQEDQKHQHRMDELGITHGHRLREALAKGAMSAVQSAMKPPPTSQAGVGGSLVEGAPMVPGLPGLEGTSALPAQAAV